MERKRNGLVPVGEAFGDLGGSLKALREARRGLSNRTAPCPAKWAIVRGSGGVLRAAWRRGGGQTWPGGKRHAWGELRERMAHLEGLLEGLREALTVRSAPS